MVEAEHEDVERVYQGQVDVMLKSIFLPPFPYSLGTLTDYHVSVAKLYAHTLYQVQPRKSLIHSRIPVPASVPTLTTLFDPGFEGIQTHW